MASGSIKQERSSSHSEPTAIKREDDDDSMADLKAVIIYEDPFENDPGNADVEHILNSIRVLSKEPMHGTGDQFAFANSFVDIVKDEFGQPICISALNLTSNDDDDDMVQVHTRMPEIEKKSEQKNTLGCEPLLKKKFKPKKTANSQLTIDSNTRKTKLTPESEMKLKCEPEMELNSKKTKIKSEPKTQVGTTDTIL